MPHSFLIPIIIWLPPNYDCTIVMPPEALAGVVRKSGGRVERYWQVVADGAVVDQGSDIIEFANGKVVTAPAADVSWQGAGRKEWPEGGGYLEFGIRAVDGEELFINKRLPGFYNIHTSPGRKSFFTCHTWKFGSPQVIGQIARFGRYVDAYTVIHIDRSRDLGDSLVLINPYMKPILAQIVTSDGRRLPRHRISAQSSACLDLAELIAPDEEQWIGQIQLTANNRLATHIVKRSLADSTVISTVEHLDPFRADATHMPLFAWLRFRAGDWLARRASR